ncbi:RNA polymerase sigma factor ShbA [Rhodococcus sp. TAF43]|uniref:RNA polymerase sigma factor ShbA n=1 Tax=unclassified Rhodococcus (in: high G+C Gram-positive bacteria) TaxID=192944 RepID=UPI000E0C7665|nr:MULTISPECIES: RNA polymerase sigma factor ShbA [unclassified Rhodococcus (in: high G+C Gram-positive bacteria)]QKT13428.1 RNA polymerase sigma factor ShbA [Rhodococcus sp. W8901]RDI24841.1 RNA polymerase sigma-70 factor (ECF subfamily) [Rhodococcus sp. AG1013]
MYGIVCNTKRIGEITAARAREVLEDWVPSAVEGDDEARSEVLAVVYPLVRRYCYARLGRGALREVAEDVAHEVCVAVLTALPRYREQGASFLTYVYAIAGHKVVDARRAAGRTCDPLDEATDPVCPDAGPAERAIASERGAHARALVDSLPERYREVVVMRVMWGMSAAETAAALGTTAGAVRIAQHRALGRLRAQSPRVVEPAA